MLLRLELLVTALVQMTVLARCGQVLVWEVLGARSHMMAMDALVRGLAQRNHSVLYVAYHEPKWLRQERNVHFVHLGIDVTSILNQMDLFNFDPFNFSLPVQNMVELQHQYLENPVIRGHIERRTQFDLTISSSSAIDMGIYLAKKVFKSPLIIFASGYSDIWTASCFGNPINPSYISGEMADVGSKMSFFERIQNTLMVPFVFLLISKNVGVIEESLKAIFHDPSIDLGQIESSADLFLLNQHPLFDKAKPINPNTIMVGGIHIDEERKQLPSDIKAWIEGAEKGVVYVSLGSVTQSSRMPGEKRKAMLRALGKLEERVIWKWEKEEEMPNKPVNVMLKKWLPQQDILAHPRVKLFVSHGGLLSTYESVYFATPMLVLPGFADQFANAHFVEQAGLGQRMRWHQLNNHSFEEKLLSILEDQSYLERAEKYSQILRDEPISPLKKAIFYAEFVMRHGGAAHLRPASLDLHWYQYLLLDVFLFFFFIFTCFIFCLKFIYDFTKRILSGRKIGSNSGKNSRKRE